MTTAIRAEPAYRAVRACGEPAPGQLPAWAVREPGEPAADWLLRLTISYAVMGHQVNDLGGQDPYPRYGASQNDIDEETPGD